MKILRAIRRALVSIRNDLDRRMHPVRGARARARLGELQPRSVLFVCLGNICRSPYAEHAWTARAAAPIEAMSAGFIGPDRRPPDEALAAGRRRGVDHAGHRSRIVTSEMMREADAVFVFDRTHARRLRRAERAIGGKLFWLGDFEPSWSGKRAIVDPWGKGDAEFEFAFSRIDRCVDEVLAALDALSEDASGRAEPTRPTP